jgi:hypothetical protein
MAIGNRGRFIWYELATHDVPAATAFYGDVARWKPEPFGDDYTRWVGSQGPLGGLRTLTADESGIPPHWTSHVIVDDVDATAALARKLGGKVLFGPEDTPEVGRFAVIADPQGAVLSVFRPREAMEPHDLSKEGEFCWNELMTSDHAAGFAFYSGLFGWTIVQDMDMGQLGTYRVFGLGDADGLGGMMTIPKGTPMPAAWIYYVSTDDLDAAIARATTRGATLLNGPMDVPGGGRIAQLTDPQGAAFALHQAPKGKG